MSLFAAHCSGIRFKIDIVSQKTRLISKYIFELEVLGFQQHIIADAIVYSAIAACPCASDGCSSAKQTNDAARRPRDETACEMTGLKQQAGKRLFRMAGGRVSCRRRSWSSWVEPYIVGCRYVSIPAITYEWQFLTTIGLEISCDRGTRHIWPWRALDKSNVRGARRAHFQYISLKSRHA